MMNMHSYAGLQFMEIFKFKIDGVQSNIVNIY